VPAGMSGSAPGCEGSQVKKWGDSRLGAKGGTRGAATVPTKNPGGPRGRRRASMVKRRSHASRVRARVDRGRGATTPGVFNAIPPGKGASSRPTKQVIGGGRFCNSQGRAVGKERVRRQPQKLGRVPATEGSAGGVPGRQTPRLMGLCSTQVRGFTPSRAGEKRRRVSESSRGGRTAGRTKTRWNRAGQREAARKGRLPGGNLLRTKGGESALNFSAVFY